MGRIEYTVDTIGHVLRTQNLLPDRRPACPIPVINDVVNLKAQYGVDANCDGVDRRLAGRRPAACRPARQLLAGCSRLRCRTSSLRQIQAVRIAIVTRSAQYEKDVVTAAIPPAMPDGTIGMFCDPAPTCAVSMTLSADDQHYRYKVLETAVPLRNATVERTMNTSPPSFASQRAPARPGERAARRRDVHRASGDGRAEPRRHRAHPLGRYGHGRVRQSRVQAGRGLCGRPQRRAGDQGAVRSRDRSRDFRAPIIADKTADHPGAELLRLRAGALGTGCLPANGPDPGNSGRADAAAAAFADRGPQCGRRCPNDAAGQQEPTT